MARNTDYWRAMLGAIILILVLLVPQGIAGSIKQLAERFRAPKEEKKAVDGKLEEVKA